VLNERQRRLKMNQKIQALKELLPKSCADVLSNKLAILHESVQHIKNLHLLVEQLNERNQYLEQRLGTVEKELTLYNHFGSNSSNTNANPNNTSPNTNNNSANMSNSNMNTITNYNNTASDILGTPSTIDPSALSYNSLSSQVSSPYQNYYHLNQNLFNIF